MGFGVFVTKKERGRSGWIVNKIIVSEETVVLRKWESETWEFSFINRGDKGRITAEKDFEKLTFQALAFRHSNFRSPTDATPLFL